MINQGLVLLFAAFAVVLSVAGLLLLRPGRLLWYWAKVAIGLLLLIVASASALVAYNSQHYLQIQTEQPVAFIQFKQLGPQHYQASLQLEQEGSSQTFELRGDQWQIDARLIKWAGPLAWLGAKPSYQLDRLQGRYLDIADERSKPRSVYGLSEPDVVFDLYQVTDRLSSGLKWFDAEYGSGTFLPMADGAAFSVKLSPYGLLARPENDMATGAIEFWE